MKSLVVTLLIPVVLLQSCAGLFMMTAFYANRSFIAKNLCENRNNELASVCGGQCVLMKKLKKQQDNENKHPELKLKELQLFGHIEQSTVLQELLPVLQMNTGYPGLSISYHQPVLSSIFHPPLCS